MKTLRQEITRKTSYRWEKSDGTEIEPEHVEQLIEHATERIAYCVEDGYTSGELHAHHEPAEGDAAAAAEYKGWWEIHDVPGATLESEVIETVRALNAELSGNNSAPVMLFTADTDGVTWRIMLGSACIWRSDQDDRYYDEESDTYEPLRDFVIRETTEMLEKALEEIKGKPDQPHESVWEERHRTALRDLAKEYHDRCDAWEAEHLADANNDDRNINAIIVFSEVCEKGRVIGIHSDRIAKAIGDLRKDEV